MFNFNQFLPGQKNKTVLLLLLDGWGISSLENSHNLFAKAKIPHFDEIVQNYPTYVLESSQISGQKPLYEIGFGKKLPSNYAEMKKDIHRKGGKISAFFTKHFEKSSSNRVHVFLPSSLFIEPSRYEDLNSFLDYLKDKTVFLHAILSGSKREGKIFMQKLEELIQARQGCSLASISGAQYVYSLSHNWKNIESYLKMLESGYKKTRKQFSNIQEIFTYFYDTKDFHDEEFFPLLLDEHALLQFSDTMCLYETQGAGLYGFLQAITLPSFSIFSRSSILESLRVISMVNFGYNLPVKHIFESIDVKSKKSLLQVLQNSDIKTKIITDPAHYLLIQAQCNNSSTQITKNHENILIHTHGDYFDFVEQFFKQINVELNYKKNQYIIAYLPAITRFKENVNSTEALSSLEYIDSYLQKLMHVSDEHESLHILLSSTASCFENFDEINSTKNEPREKEYFPYIHIHKDAEGMSSYKDEAYGTNLLLLSKNATQFKGIPGAVTHIFGLEDEGYQDFSLMSWLKRD